MFDINTINKRYFQIHLTVNTDDGNTSNINLEIEAPKVKSLKKIITLSKNKDDENALFEAIKIILNKNRTGYIVSDDIIDELDIDEYNGILIAFFNWLNEVRSSPN